MRLCTASGGRLAEVLMIMTHISNWVCLYSTSRLQPLLPLLHCPAQLSALTPYPSLLPAGVTSLSETTCSSTGGMVAPVP